MPVGLYGCEFWTPLSIPIKNYTNEETILKSWESFAPETLNKRICRLLLSVHKKSSCLAVLGELASYPIFMRALIQSLKYEWTLRNKSSPSSLAYCAINEMESLVGQGNINWLSNVNKMKNHLSIPNLPSHLSPNSAGNKITKLVKSHFDEFYLNQINKVSFSEDGLDHN